MPAQWLRRWFRRREGERLLGEVSELLGRSRFSEAESLCERALGAFEAACGEGAPEVATPLYVLGAVRLARGGAEGARGPCRQAISIAEAAARPTEPRLPEILLLLAAIEERLDNLTEVEGIYRRMLSGYERMRDPDALEVASLLNRLALLLSRKKADVSEASALFEQAIAHYNRAPDAGGTAAAEALYNHGTHLLSLGRVEEAERALQRALAILDKEEEAAAMSGPLLPSVLHNLAAACAALGRPEEAEILLVRALRLAESKPDDEPPGLLRALDQAGAFYASQGRFQEAEPLLQKAASIRKARADA